MAEAYDHMRHLREIAKRCQVCKVPMIGTTSTDRQKFCSPECRKMSSRTLVTVKEGRRWVTRWVDKKENQ